MDDKQKLIHKIKDILELSDIQTLERIYKKLNNTKPISINRNPFYTLTEVVKQEHMDSEVNIWKNQQFEKINSLKCDSSGRVGELFIHRFCLENNIKSTYIKDKIFTDGVYDVMINNKKVEIKTARIGKNKIFQHENLRNSGCDYYMFIDVEPAKFFITILKKFDLKQRCVITNRKPHLRKYTLDAYKYDFSNSTIKKYIKSGNTICLRENDKNKNLYNFIVKWI